MARTFRFSTSQKYVDQLRDESNPFVPGLQPLDHVRSVIC